MEGVIVFVSSSVICGVIQLVRYRNNVNSWDDDTPYWYVSIVLRALMTICLTVLLGVLFALLK